MSDEQEMADDVDNALQECTEQYLTFILEGEEFAIDILRVQEIKSWDKATNLPGSPYYVEGAINLRGTIVPIIDLRKRFNLPEIEFDYTTVVIVIKVLGEQHDRIMGIIVDAVSDVHSLVQSSIRPAPDMKGKLDTQFVTGLTTINDKMVIVMDIDTLMNSDDLLVEIDEE